MPDPDTSSDGPDQTQPHVDADRPLDPPEDTEHVDADRPLDPPGGPEITQNGYPESAGPES
jgi:hypothetical protein